jgi:hypothetical protein
MPTCLQTSTHGIAEIMATYSREDFEEIASAIDKDIADVCQQEKHFEAAAMWYRLDRKAPKRQTPFVMRGRMTQIVNTARKLLRYLEVEDPSQAPDGPGIAILHVLASTDDGTEDAVVRATARIGRLVEILEAVDAARELERRASMGAEDAVQIGELVVPKGHHGQVAVNDWIAAMMSIYQKITGTDPGISVVAPGRPGRGKAAGPLIRFLQAAGKPIGIESSADSLAGRIKDVRTGGRRRKK